MPNTSALAAGRQKAKDLIQNHILMAILIPLAEELKKGAEERRIQVGHNMTGNTVNSYAAGVYHNGKLVWDSYSGVYAPLRNKLSKGDRFYAGNQRWDGELQEKTFEAQVATNGKTEAERSISFIKGFQPTSKGFELVVCNGVEYATFQESSMGIEVLSGSYDTALMAHAAFFKPID